MNVGLEKIQVFSEGVDSPFVPGRVILEPLTRGYGDTIGFSLRRIMLSSMPGAAVVGIKIAGVNHEFSSIPGAATDATELVCNLKRLRFRLEEDRTYTLKFNKNESGMYSAKDLDLPPGVEIQNPEHELINLTGSEAVSLEVYVKMGRGMVDSTLHAEYEDQEGVISVDGMFTPIRNIGYKIEAMRIGQDTSYERLIFDVTTDGSIHPKEAVLLAAKIAKTHYDFFEGISDYADRMEIYIEKKEEEEENRLLDLSIEKLDLSVRSYNGLKRSGLLSVRQIITLKETDVANIQQLGEKSVDEIVKKMIELGFELQKD
jgi:DNA-directed RNA polymerase subunit alpha